MENLLSHAEAIFDGQMNRAQFIWMLIACVVILCGFIIIGISLFYRLKGEAVMLKVVHLHEEERDIKDDDDAGRIAEKKANPLIRPEFEIVDGPHRGLRHRSSSASSKSEHELSEIVSGYFFPKSGDIASQGQIQSGTKYGFVFVLMGGITMIISKVMASSWAG